MWARQRRQVSLDCGFDQAMAKALAAAQVVYDGASYDRQVGTVVGSNGFSLSSYGDVLTITASKRSPNSTVLEIYSKAVWGFVDFGHNKRLVNRLVVELEKLTVNVVDLRPAVIDLAGYSINSLDAATAPAIL